MVGKKTYATLASCPLFRGIHPDDLQGLLAQCPPSTRAFRRGEMIATRGERYEKLWVVASGALAAEMIDLRGRVLKVETLEAPSPIATAVLFAKNNRLPVQLRAQTNGKLIILEQRAVLRICQASERFLLNYLQDTGDKVTFLAEKIRILRFSTIRQKLASHLLDLCLQQKTNAIELPYSVEAMADLFGVARPALSRILSELVEEGVLARSGRDYHVSDAQALRELLEP